MADHHEHDIATYLTLDGKVFVAPQFNVAYDRELNEGGACPDFVALDLDRREVVIVEVTAAANLQPLFGRIRDRDTRWYRPIRRSLPDTVVDGSWPTRVLAFIRRPGLDMARRVFNGTDDVAFWAIEDATFPWSYWDERLRDGLPR